MLGMEVDRKCGGSMYKNIYDHIDGITLFLLSALIRVSIFMGGGTGLIFPDSASYIEYSFFEFRRSPGYPLVISVFQCLMGDNWKLGVVIFQIAMACLSVVILYKTIIMVFDEIQKSVDIPIFVRKPIAYIISLLFAPIPSLSIWDHSIHTESLSVSCSVFFIYMSIKWILSKKTKDGAIAALVGLLGFMIKTALFIYPICLIILWVLMFVSEKTQRKNILGMGILLGFVVVFFVIWVRMVYKYTGVVSVSDLTALHSLIKTIDTGQYKYWPDAELVNEIEQVIISRGPDTSVADIAHEAINIFPDKKSVVAYTKYCLNADRENYYKYQILLMWNNRWTSVITPYSSLRFIPGYIEAAYHVFFKVLYIFIFALFGLLMGMIRWIRHKSCPYIIIGLSGGMLTILISVFWGSYAEWGRLLVYIVPFIFVSVSYYIYIIIGKVVNIYDLNKHGQLSDMERNDSE
ncbi:MAG: glycosyltransferase family 39 protein [Lachnospiraceae bacterium]|nr:glycosyltransferase family 39 protein [Lachnospiraceae bacterium]